MILKKPYGKNGNFKVEEAIEYYKDCFKST